MRIIVARRTITWPARIAVKSITEGVFTHRAMTCVCRQIGNITFTTRNAHIGRTFEMRNSTYDIYCEYCSSPAVSLDMENTYTKSYCQEHTPPGLSEQKVSTTEESRRAHCAAVMDHRMLHHLCFICGAVGVSSVVTAFFPQTWWCEKHQDKAQEFLMEHS